MRKSINQIKKIITLLFVVLICTGCREKCEECHQYITIINKSDKKIAFQVSVNEQNETFYCSDDGRTILISVESNSTFKLDDGDDYSSWDNFVKTLDVFIVDGEIYDEYWQQPCDTIHKYVPILDTYRLTLADLQRMNWTVVFPPEEQIH